MSITAAVEAVFVITGVAHLCAVGLLGVDMRRGRLHPAVALDPRTEFVALVDAGYQVDANWLAETVGANHSRPRTPSSRFARTPPGTRQC